jgi:hypothetical protein
MIDYKIKKREQKSDNTNKNQFTYYYYYFMISALVGFDERLDAFFPERKNRL